MFVLKTMRISLFTSWCSAFSTWLNWWVLQ